MLRITSTKNPRIKSLIDLSYAKERRQRQVFSVEGAREIHRAVTSGYSPIEIYICPEILSDEARSVIDTMTCSMTDVSEAVFQKIAMRSDKDGIVAVFPSKNLTFEQIKLRSHPLIIAAQGIEKPGNLGALIRSADAAGADCVVVLDQDPDLYHPQVIRNSLGTVFHVPILSLSSSEFRQKMGERNIPIYAAALTPHSQPYDSHDYRASTAFLLGEEANGLTADWFVPEITTVKIPMLGLADSLNVSVAGALLLYEAVRQRQ